MKKLLIISLLLLNIVSVFALSNYVETGLDSLYEGNAEAAFIVFRKGANTNDIIAQYLLAICYEHGIGTEKMGKEAFLMYRRTAERGLANAMLDLSRCYTEGIGIEKNIEKGVIWKEKFLSKKNVENIPDIINIYYSREIPHQENIKDEIQDEKVFLSKESPKKGNIITEHPSNKEITSVIISDVDIDIPVINKVNNNTFALIIANENYQEVANVDMAINDGEIFSLYCNKVLGLPETNIHLVKDGTLNNIKRKINLFQQIAETFNGEASFIIYYAGHGFPDEKSRKAFLLPIDGYVFDTTTCLSLEDLYDTLGKIPAQQIIILMDACFSGSTRGNDMLASARGIAIKAEKGVPVGNTVVISSSQGDETSYPYSEKNHGLFTYYLLKILKESKGDISIEELTDYISENVARTSIVVNGKSQTPSLMSSKQLKDNWKTWKIIKN